MEVLRNIPFEITPIQIIELLGSTKKNTLLEGTIQNLLKLVGPIANPKALYKIAYVDHIDEVSVEIDGVPFTSKILGKNLKSVGRVFPYVVTCGKELDSIQPSTKDIMKQFCFDTIKEMILFSAHVHLEKHLKEKYAVTQLSHMNPGSLDDWPMEQQEPLFSILGNVETLIGVTLRDSYLMDPVKSVSGIYFPTEIHFESCMLCPRQDCSHRRSKFDPGLASEYRIIERS